MGKVPCLGERGGKEGQNGSRENQESGKPLTFVLNKGMTPTSTPLFCYLNVAQF